LFVLKLCKIIHLSYHLSLCAHAWTAGLDRGQLKSIERLRGSAWRNESTNYVFFCF